MLSVISLSDILPVYALEIYVIDEFGATAMRNFSVLWCLYVDQVIA